MQTVPCPSSHPIFTGILLNLYHKLFSRAQVFCSTENMYYFSTICENKCWAQQAMSWTGKWEHTHLRGKNAHG